MLRESVAQAMVGDGSGATEGESAPSTPKKTPPQKRKERGNLVSMFIDDDV